MDDKMLVRCSTLKITKDEEAIVNLDDVRTDTLNPITELAIVGKVMTMRPYNFEVFKRTMNQIWAFQKTLYFK